jgi:hypothetical protein
MDAGNAIIYVTGPILSRISNGPQNLVANLEQFPSLKELLLAFNFRKT